MDPHMARSIRMLTELSGLGVIVGTTVIGLSSGDLTAAAGGRWRLDDFQLTFSDDFKTLDISVYGPGIRWIASAPWSGDFGDASFDNPGSDVPFSLGPNGLQITATRDAAGSQHSRLVASMDKDAAGQHRLAQRFGYFEMRATFPPGPVVWPAFWLVGTEKSKSAAIIDIAEYYGFCPEYFDNWPHLFVNRKNTLNAHNVRHVHKGRLTGNFNDCGVLIEPDTIRIYRNNQIIWKELTPTAFTQPMYILADLAVDSGWPIDKTISPSVLQIEIIYSYRRKSRMPAQEIDHPPSRAEANAKLQKD